MAVGAAAGRSSITVRPSCCSENSATSVRRFSSGAPVLSRERVDPTIVLSAHAWLGLWCLSEDALRELGLLVLDLVIQLLPHEVSTEPWGRPGNQLAGPQAREHMHGRRHAVVRCCFVQPTLGACSRLPTTRQGPG